MSLVDQTRADLEGRLEDDDPVAVGQDKMLHRAPGDGTCRARCRGPARVTIMDWATAKRLGYGADGKPVCRHNGCFGGESDE